MVAAETGDAAAVDAALLAGPLPDVLVARNRAGQRALDLAKDDVCSRALRAAAGWTPLMFAVDEGDVGRMRALIAGGAVIDAADMDQRTALYHAALAGRAAAVGLLVECRADVRSTDSEGQTPLAATKDAACQRLLKLGGADGWTPLMVAADEADAAAVLAAIATGQGRDGINAANAAGATALHLAAAKGSVAVVRALVDAQAGLNRRDRKGRVAMALGNSEEVRAVLRAAGADGWTTPLMTAAAAGDADQVQVLIAEGAPLDVRDEAGRSALDLAAGEAAAALKAAGADGWTPLMVAAEAGDAAAVAAALAAGGDVSAKNEGLMTALHLAAQRGSAEAVRLIVEGGADVFAKDKAGREPIDLAVKDQCREALRRSGADGWTPLMVAADKGDAEAVVAILAAGEAGRGGAAGVEARNKDRMGALHLAAERGCAGAVQALLAAGADPNATGRLGWTPLALARRSAACQAALKAAGADGWTPLMVAAEAGDAAAVAAALAGGADARVSGRGGVTALHLVAGSGAAEAVRALLAGGADAAARDKYGRIALDVAKGAECRAALTRQATAQE
jgi:cytohesin